MPRRAQPTRRKRKRERSLNEGLHSPSATLYQFELLSSQRRVCREAPPRFGVNRLGWNRHGFPLRIAKRRQVSSINTAGIDVDCVVEPHGFYHRRVPIHYERIAAITRGPVHAHRRPELIQFAVVLAT